MTDLKRCPFCGGKARLVISEHENSDTTRWHKIMCEDVFGCGAEIGTAISAWQADYKETVQRLISRWNRRYEPSEPEHTMEEFMFGQDIGNPEDGSL